MRDGPLSRLLEPARFLAGLVRSQELSLLEGAERSKGLPLSMLCACPEDLRDGLLKRAFKPGAKVLPLGRAPLRETCEALSLRAPGADLVVRHVRRALEFMPRGPVLARLPAWVRTEVDLASPLCAERGKEKMGRNRRSTERVGYAMALGRTEEDYARFYDEMHLPYVTARHGQGASVQTRAEVLDGLRRGRWELMVVSKGGVPVAGGTVEFDGENARFWQIGIKDADPALLAEGAPDAVYHFMFALCRERGVRRLHLGHSRPFARDGVLEYKRMLGAYVAPGRDARRGSIDLAVRRLTPAVADFLAENPMITLEDDGRVGLRAWARGSDEEIAATLERLRRHFCFAGTVALRAFVLEGDGFRELPS